jgi:GrpB-like predicted nucleotidyltransferase (UPF0157 family)
MEIVTFKKAQDFQPSADAVFTAERFKILRKLPNAEVHHVGSTSVSGLLTKGDLDINIRVLRGDFAAAVDILKKMYNINQPENWAEGDYASFKSDRLKIDFGAQLTVKGSPHDFFLKFRELLRNNPKFVEQYNQLKVMHEGKSMTKYRNKKEKFCALLLKK